MSFATAVPPRGPSLILALAAALLAGCASLPPQAPALTAIEPQAGYRFVTTRAEDNRNSLLIVMSFSGGGMRAAALACAAHWTP